MTPDKLSRTTPDMSVETSGGDRTDNLSLEGCLSAPRLSANINRTVSATPMSERFSPRLVRAVRRLRGVVDQPTFDAMLQRCWPPSRLSPDVAKLERLTAEITAPRDAEALAAIVAYLEGTRCFMAGDAPDRVVGPRQTRQDEVTP